MTSSSPSDPDAWTQRGVALRAAGDAAGAVEAHREAVRLAPGSAWAWGHLALSLQEAGQAGEARDAYEDAIRLGDDPVDRMNYGMLLLAQGDYARGWTWHEYRRRVPTYPGMTLPFPEWTGDDLAGRTLLIWPEHGFGDQIQFARYALAARDRGARVLLACPPDLAALFGELGVEIFSLTGQVEIPQPDVWAPIMSLPHLFGATREDIPPAPYLKPPADRLAKWRGAVPPRRVGVVWRGSPGHPNDANRSLPSLAALAPLTDAGAQLIDLQTPKGDFADTAAIISQLDLVVCVDTAMAHLAGALGVPCWVLLPTIGCDWRWGLEGDTTPWYPSLRLFRQTAAGDWSGAIEALAGAWRER